MATEPGLNVENDDGPGVRGASGEGIGVVGRSDGESPAIYGNASNATGIWGTGRGVGVLGTAEHGDGVWGVADSHGVRGTGGIGVFGESPAGQAVVGRSNSGTGVRGVSSSGWGGYFNGGLYSPDFSVLNGGLWVGGDIGLIVGGATNLHDVFASGASTFLGGAMVFGWFQVLGAKLAVVPHPDGSYRGLYSMESPESWFEDFGTAKVVRGKATVKLDRNFVAVVRGDYHIFLSAEGNSKGLRKPEGSQGLRSPRAGRGNKQPVVQLSGGCEASRYHGAAI